MSIYSTERQRKTKDREQRFYTVRRLEGALAQSALLRIHEELAADPDVNEFETPVLRPDVLALKILKYAPEEVARRINLGRSVMLSLDDSVEPPMLRISLGDPIVDASAQ